MKNLFIILLSIYAIVITTVYGIRSHQSVKDQSYIFHLEALLEESETYIQALEYTFPEYNFIKESYIDTISEQEMNIFIDSLKRDCDKKSILEKMYINYLEPLITWELKKEDASV